MSSTPRLFQMTGTCNNYPWGKKGRESLAARLRAKTPSHTDLTIQHDEAYSELWFGDYPDYPARVVESGRPLAEVIANDREGLLGSDSVQRFGENMPFLPKILSIAKALPLQTHPNKSLAAKLHQLHPDKFPDANHKPEIAVALSRFELFAGWKEIDQISPLFNLPSLRQFVPEGTREWDAETLRNVVRGLLKADEQTVQTIGEDLKQQSDHDLNKLDFRQSVADLVLRLQSQHSAMYRRRASRRRSLHELSSLAARRRRLHTIRRYTQLLVGGYSRVYGSVQQHALRRALPSRRPRRH